MSLLDVVGKKRINNVKDDKSILKYLVDNNIYINNPCNGNGTCGKCKIKIISGEVTPLKKTEEKFLTTDEINDKIRLACMTNVNPTIDITRIEIREKEKKVEVLADSYIKNFEKDNLRDGYGIAIDIGTTTVVCELINLNDGKTITYASMVNPQKKYGLDVLTRITYENEMEKEGINNLKEAIVSGINELIKKIIDNVKIERNKINTISVAANCTMMHMLLGIDARSIGKYPYKPLFLEKKILKAKDIGIEVNDECDLICLPSVSSFIGADIVSGIYTCDLENIPGNVLFIDIGTNAEIVLKTNDDMVSCSCAAGPALEGMNISNGMRAEEGAIEDVIIQNEEIKIKTIGDLAPVGLCGSGILAIIKEMIKNEIIKKNGVIIKPDTLSEDDYRKKRIKVEDNKKRFVINENPEITITQSDIRQVQLAKGAILSGFTALINYVNIDMKNLDKVLVAGQFGAHLPAESLVGVGVLPYEVIDKIEYVGNVSKTGAYITLLKKNALEELEELSKKVKYIELADTKDYEKIFVKAMEFPENINK